MNRKQLDGGHAESAQVPEHVAIHETPIGAAKIGRDVGDRYVLEEMLRTDAMLGGEQSGHVIFREHATTGDGLLTAVRFLSLATADGASVAELSASMVRYPQVIVNVPVGDRERLARIVHARGRPLGETVPATMHKAATGLLAGLDGDALGAAHLLAEAESETGAWGRRYDAACIALDLADALERAGDDDGAADARGRAQAVLEPLGCVNPY